MVEKIQEVKDVHLIQGKLDDVNKLIAPYKLAWRRMLTIWKKAH